MIRDDADAKAILAKVRNGELSPQAAEEWATSIHQFPTWGDLFQLASPPRTSAFWKQSNLDKSTLPPFPQRAEVERADAFHSHF